MLMTILKHCREFITKNNTSETRKKIIIYKICLFMYNYIKLYIKHFFPGRFESGLSYKYSVTGVFYQFEIIIFPLFFYIKKGKHVNICMLSKFLSINFA